MTDQKETSKVSTAPLHTEFAPAERTDRQNLLRQHLVWKKEEQVHLIGEAVPNLVLILNNTRQIVYANSKISLFGDYEKPESYLGMRPGELVNCTHAFKTEGGCGTTSFCENCQAGNAILSSLTGMKVAEECIITRGGGEPPLQLRVMTTPVKLQDEDFVIFSIEDIRMEKENQRLLQEVQRLAVLDPLTGILNRRAFYEDANREFKRSVRYQHPLTVIMFDADKFKAINDNYGHPAGDAFLKAIAMNIRANLRDLDVFARYGGDEFIALLPETGLNQAKDIAGRMVEVVSTILVRFAGGVVHPSISAGVAEFEPTDRTLEALIARADADLLRIKREKNRGK